LPADPYEHGWTRVEVAVLDTPGALAPDTRLAISRGHDPAELAVLLEKVRNRAYEIVDADVDGLDADVVFEAVLAAALAEGDRRRLAALEAIG
jgi:hypothetical protein